MTRFPTTVITPHLVRREFPLINCMRSVMHQVLQPEAHLIGTDLCELGSALTRNTLMQGVETEYVSFLDDDDWLFPEHFKTIAEEASGADWVFTNWELGPGRTSPLSIGWIPEAFKHMNILPVTATVKADLVRQVGGFRKTMSPVDGNDVADYDLWKRVLALGVEPVYIDTPLWMYGFINDAAGGHNERRAEETEAAPERKEEASIPVQSS